jgi:hypothetical protein
LIGAGVRAVAGFFAYRNDGRKCAGCGYAGLTAVSVFTVGLGLGTGFIAGRGVPSAAERPARGQRGN